MLSHEPSQERPWPAERDHSLVFDAALLNEALAAWSDHAEPGRIPSRSSLARDLKSFLANTVMCERLNDGRYRISRVGSRIALMLGELEGLLVEQCVPPEMAQRWTNAFDMVLTELRPIRFVSAAPFLHIEFLRVEVLLAPLLDEAHEPRLVLAVATFKADSDMGTQRNQAGHPSVIVIEEQVR
jgi:hypothetical protein